MFFPPFGMPMAYDSDGFRGRGRGRGRGGGRGRGRGRNNSRHRRSGMKGMGRGHSHMKGARNGRRGRGDSAGGKGGDRGRGRRVDGYHRGGSRDGKGRSTRDKSGDKDSRRGGTRARKVPVPQMDASNFPSLGDAPAAGSSTAAPVATAKKKSPREATKPRVSYTASTLLQIVQSIPGACIRKPDALQGANFPELVLDSPMDELLLRQRTVSMEMVDKDVRHGKPIRVDRAGSADYDSMMYGEGQKQQKP